MKTISTYLAILFIVTICPITQAQCDWENLGPPDINTLNNQGGSYSDLALDSDDLSHVVFSDGAEGGKVTVRKFDGTVWSTLGTAGFSVGQATHNSIAFNSSNELYATYCDLGSGGRAIVKKFDGTDWVQVGTDLSSASAEYTSLVIDENDIPYVAFRDAANGNGVTVLSFDGTSWNTVGSAGFSSADAAYTSLAIDPTGVLYVVFQDNGNGGRATVKMFDGTDWVSVGLEGFSIGTANYTDIAINSAGTPYVVYCDAGNSNRATVKFFDGMNWSTLASELLEAAYTTISIDENDLPFVAYKHTNTNDFKVHKYVPATNSWTYVGGWYFTNVYHPYCSIQFSSDGTFHVGFIDTGYKTVVYKCVNNLWEMIGVPGFSAGLTRRPTAMTISNSGVPHVAYYDVTQRNRIVVKRFNGSEWEAVGGPNIGSPIGNTNSYSIAIAIDDNDMIYVVCSTNSYYVQVLKFDGVLWDDFGSIPTSGWGCRDGVGFDIATASDNIPYISFRCVEDNAPDENHAAVKKYNPTWDFWGSVGGGTISYDNIISGTSLVLDSNDVPYIAFQDASVDYKTVVRRCNPSTQVWETVGPYGLSAGQGNYSSLAMDKNGTLYVVYQDFTIGGKATVKKYNGTNWVTVGLAGFSAGEVHSTDIVIDAGGTPYVIFGDVANDDKATVMRFNGTDWVTVGNAGFSGDDVTDLSYRTTGIVTDDDGTVYAAYYNKGYAAAKKFNSSISVHHQTACPSDLPVVWNGDNYSSTGTYQHVFTNELGCDSTVTLHLTVNPAATGTDTQLGCETFTWIDGNTYMANNNVATHTIVGGAANGCDSTVTLNLTIEQPSTSIDTQVACESLTWIDGNTYTSNNNTAMHTFIGGAVNGCDSIVTLDLSIEQSSTGTDVQTVCESLTWIDGNTYTTNNNTATHTIISGAANGCDSIVTLNLIVEPASFGTDAQTVCESLTWIDGNTYTANNNTATYTISGGAVNGCDSIISLDLIVNPSSAVTDSYTVCDSLQWIDGNTYTSSTNTPTWILTNLAGCDSIITLNLTVNSINALTTQLDDITIQANSSGVQYQWLDCDSNFEMIIGETNQTFTAMQNGNYAVQLSANGCVDTSECVNIMNVGIIENDFGDNLKVYPNPTDGNLTISLSTEYQFVEVTIIDINGKTVSNEFFNESGILDVIIDGESGTYILKITSEGKNAQVKVVKN